MQRPAEAVRYFNEALLLIKDINAQPLALEILFYITPHDIRVQVQALIGSEASDRQDDSNVYQTKHFSRIVLETIEQLSQSLSLTSGE